MREVAVLKSRDLNFKTIISIRTVLNSSNSFEKTILIFFKSFF